MRDSARLINLMKLTLEINKKIACLISDNFFSGVARKTIELSSYRFLGSKNIILSLAVIGNDEMKKINRQFRKKDCATDVLSFPNYKKDQLSRLKEKTLFLGEILIDFPYIKKSAKMRDIEIKDELGYVVSHGILHCLGFSHGKKMFEIQNLVSKNKKN